MTAHLALIVDEWFDGDVRHVGRHTLSVRAGRIEAITPGDHGEALQAQGAEVTRGTFLMPGLVDAHVHLFLDGAPTDGAVRSAHMKQTVEQLTEAALASARQSLACGVTWVRDAGDKHDINNTVREAARDADAGLCRVRSGGRGIKRAKRYGAFMASDVADDPDITASVTALAQRNDEIKLILTGIIDFDAGAVTDEPQFTAPEARLVVQTAHAHGRKVFAHCSGVKGLAVAVDAGVDSIEHGFFMNRETLAQMRDRGLAWTPTFCPVHFQWAHPEAVGWSPNTVGNLRRILDSHAEHLRLAHEMGVTLLLGTDAGSMGVEHGRAMVEEMARYVEAGLPLADVLRAATTNNRRHFGLQPGTLAVGAPFEAVLLAGSPWDDWQALHRPVRVWPV